MQKTEKHFFCPLPWTGYALRNDGAYRVCCFSQVSDGSGLLLDKAQPHYVYSTPFDSLRNHSLLKSMRKDFINGLWPKSCLRCKRDEASGAASGRTHALDRVDKVAFAERINVHTGGDGHISAEKFPVEDIDIRLGNTCNLACRSCGPSDSSGWFTDMSALENHLGAPPTKRSHFRWHDTISTQQLFPQDMSAIRRIYLVGGEPMLSSAHLRFLSDLIEKNISQNITLEYNTNLTFLSSTVLELWTKFKQVCVGVSLDGVYDHHEYLRYPSTFSKLEKLLDQLDETPNNVVPWLSCTISILNVTHIVNFIRWKYLKKFKKIGSGQKPYFSHHFVHMPYHLNLQSLPQEIKSWVSQRVQMQASHFTAEHSLTANENKSLQSIIHSTINFMNLESSPEHFEKFKLINNSLDHIRKQKFSDIDPEFSKIIEDYSPGTLAATRVTSP